MYMYVYIYNIVIYIYIYMHMASPHERNWFVGQNLIVQGLVLLYQIRKFIQAQENVKVW